MKDIAVDKEMISYCGLYCQDCIPSNKELFTRIRGLLGVLGDLQFEKYAQIKSQKNEVFSQYPMLIKMLSEMTALECIVPCRRGGGNSTCKIKECVLGRGYAGCWDCDMWKTCELLRPLHQVHPNLEYHLDLIKKEGLQNWSAKRRQHYCFTQDSFLQNDP